MRDDDIPLHLQTKIEIKDVTNDPGVVDGVSLMKVLIGKVQFQEMKSAQQKSKRLYDKFRVTYEWDGEDLRQTSQVHGQTGRLGEQQELYPVHVEKGAQRRRGWP